MEKKARDFLRYLSLLHAPSSMPKSIEIRDWLVYAIVSGALVNSFFQRKQRILWAREKGSKIRNLNIETGNPPAGWDSEGEIRNKFE